MLKVIFVFTMLSAGLASADDYVCVLENSALKKSKVALIENAEEGGGDEARVRVYKNMDSMSPDGLLADYDVADGSEDVQILLSNDQEKVSVSFYLDESDALGLMEGSMESKVMSGNIKCNRH